MVAITALFGMAAVAASAAPPPNAARADPGIVDQASATVRIVSGVRITHGRPPKGEAMITETRVRASDGTSRSVKLIEFP